MSRKVITLVSALLLVLLATGCAEKGQISAETPPEVKNIIFFIGDGMGYSQVSISRILSVGEDGRLWMETAQAVGTASSYSADSLITDSAAAGTALATGHKTNNGIISMTPDLKPLKTILEVAKERGKSTGLITTVTITHATVATFASHIDHRKKEAEIALQYAKNKNVDVLLGGGRHFFIPKSSPGSKRKDELNLIEEFKKAGYAYVKTAAELKATTASKILGLFAMDAMAYTIDREEIPEASSEPTLADMTKKAIETLNKNPKGFFLVVEGGKIDWACHGNDPGTTIQDVLAFDKAVKVGLDFLAKNPDTLVIVTADHETGGMSLITEKKDVLEGVKKQTASSFFIANELGKGADINTVMSQYAGITDLTTEEMKLLRTRKSLAVAQVISKRVGIGWTTTGHSGNYIPVYAFGKGAQRFTGVWHLTDIPKITAELSNLKL